MTTFPIKKDRLRRSFLWWALKDSNFWPSPCKGDALPTELNALFSIWFSLPAYFAFWQPVSVFCLSALSASPVRPDRFWLSLTTFIIVSKKLLLSRTFYWSLYSKFHLKFKNGVILSRTSRGWKALAVPVYREYAAEGSRKKVRRFFGLSPSEWRFFCY